MPSKKSPVPEKGRPVPRGGSNETFWPIALISVGLVWLARNMGWLDRDVPWLPLLLIGLGVYLIVRQNSRRNDKQNPA
ncbi:hypothetical protein JW777_11100 [bacterium]|nr:hypothetical protein [bacterium]